MSIMPDTHEKVWSITETNPEIWTSITSGVTGGEGNWLNSGYTPG
jgi:hypothetical protein